jgi:hypothetical protein
VFTDRYLETVVCSSTYLIPTAVFVRFEVSAQQRAYTPQYHGNYRAKLLFATAAILRIDFQ